MPQNNPKQYYVLTQNPHFVDIVTWLDLHGEWFEPHLNRTRFTLTPGRTHTEFMLRWSEHIGQVADNDYITPEQG